MDKENIMSSNHLVSISDRKNIVGILIEKVCMQIFLQNCGIVSQAKQQRIG